MTHHGVIYQVVDVVSDILTDRDLPVRVCDFVDHLHAQSFAGKTGVKLSEPHLRKYSREYTTEQASRFTKVGHEGLVIKRLLSKIGKVQ